MTHASNLRAATALRASAWPGTVRPLGVTEHLFWLLDQHRSIHFAVTAHVSGATNVGDWRRAIDRVQQRHPLMTVSISGEPGGAMPQFLRGDVPPIPLRVIHGDPQSRWRSEVGVELATPFKPDTAPLLRAVLIQAERDAALVLVAHYAVADGMSLAYAMRDILTVVGGGMLAVLSSTPSTDDLLQADEKVPAAAAEDAPAQEAAPSEPAMFRPLDDAQPSVRGLSLSPVTTARLRDVAHREGTTLHCALCAALAIGGRQAAERWQEIPMRVLSPVNARSQLGAGEHCGVFVSAASTVIHPGAEGFWDLARQAKAQVAPGQTREGIAGFTNIIRAFIETNPVVAEAADFAAAHFGREALLTNLGSLPFGSRFGHLRLISVWGPCVLQGLEDEQAIGVATVDGRLCLVHTSHSPIDGLLDAMRSVVVEACFDGPGSGEA